MSDKNTTIRLRDNSIRMPDAQCATHGAVVPMTVWATVTPEFSAKVCPKCLVEFMGRTFPVTLSDEPR